MTIPFKASFLALGKTARHPKRLRCCAAFTLVEVIVSGLVIAVLLAICLPAVSSIRRRTEDIGCKNNLKILAECINAFSFDNNNDLPTAWDGHTAWPALLLPYVKTVVIDTKTTREGPFYCPSTRYPGKGLGIYERDQATVRTDYGANDTAMSDPPTKRSRFSTMTITLYDGTGYKTGPPAEAKKRARHAGRSNILFLDGHVESLIDFPTGDQYWKVR